MSSQIDSVRPNEALLPIREACERRLGFRPSSATLHRWRLRGVRGHRLPVVKVGHFVLTSVEAVDRWVAATQPLLTPLSAPPIDDGIARAEQLLKSAGV